MSRSFSPRLQEPSELDPRPETERKIVKFDAEQKRQLSLLCRQYYDEAIWTDDDREQLRAHRYRCYLSDPTRRNGLQPWSGPAAWL